MCVGVWRLYVQKTETEMVNAVTRIEMKLCDHKWAHSYAKCY
jgi:hypothetical protein